MGGMSGLKIDARRKQIQDILTREGKVRVSQLSSILGASEVTIRNDLAELEKNGYLERISGGAVLTTRNYYNMDFQQRKQERAAEKQSIAIAAANLVNDGDTLMINSGTTSFFTAVELKKLKNLNIVTNSISIAMELGHHPTFRVILLGGEINPQYSFSYGIDAISQLQKYKADKVILSVDGICVNSGITTYHAEETEINKIMLNRAQESIIVGDYTKVGHESFSYICDLARLGCFVTNDCADETQLSEIEKYLKIIKC